MRRSALVCFLLAVAVAAVYWPVHSYPFINIDDQGYVYANPHVRAGLTAESVRHAFTDVTVGNWHPLTVLSHMLDCQLFGVESGSGWHHCVNVVLHIANTLLLFLALSQMTGTLWRSAIVAGLFGLHPLHVESVAWVAERKDVLSTLFFMLALLAYYRYARRPGALRFAPVLLCMALGLLAKPMLVTLPFVLLLLDLWPLGRVIWPTPAPASNTDATDAGEDKESAEENEAEDDLPKGETIDGPLRDGSAENATAPAEELTEDRPFDFNTGLPQAKLGQLVAEKIPLFLMALAFSAITFVVQGGEGAMNMLGGSLPLSLRLSNAISSYARYLEKAFVPTSLAVFYPYTRPRLIDLIVLIVALIAISLAAWRLLRARPYVAVGWCWYLGTLVPVLGLVQVGAQSMADRYTYIPLIGIFIIVVWAAADYMAHWPVANRGAVAVIVLTICGLMTLRQVTYWSSSTNLFVHATEVVPGNFFAHHCLGMIYWDAHRLDDAAEEFQAELKISDKLEPAHRALGVLASTKEEPKPAVTELLRAIELQPRQPEAHRHLAWLLATFPDSEFRDGERALEQAKIACQLTQRRLPEYWDTLAAAYAETGNFEDARKAIAEAIDMAGQTGDEDMLPALRERAALYADNKPFHAPIERPKRL